MIEISKDFVYKLIIDMEDTIESLDLKTSGLTKSEYEKYISTKNNLFELKKIYLKNR